jgi:hypothetical protein
MSDFLVMWAVAFGKSFSGHSREDVMAWKSARHEQAGVWHVSAHTFSNTNAAQCGTEYSSTQDVPYAPQDLLNPVFAFPSSTVS